jgi:uncharacterized protein
MAGMNRWCAGCGRSSTSSKAPFVLALIVLIELSGKGEGWLSYVAVIFVLGRMLHVIGMDSDTVPATRVAGVAITMLTLIGLAVMAVLISAGVY